jgi:hypothetical protein
MTQVNKSRLRNMRNSPVEDICNFSDKLMITYCDNSFILALTAPDALKHWGQTAVAKLARQGKPFRIENTVCGIHVVATGKRK